jgi:hypothetical protein
LVVANPKFGDVRRFGDLKHPIEQYLRQKSWRLKHENRAFGSKL